MAQLQTDLACVTDLLEALTEQRAHHLQCLAALSDSPDAAAERSLLERATAHDEQALALASQARDGLQQQTDALLTLTRDERASNGDPLAAAEALDLSAHWRYAHGDSLKDTPLAKLDTLPITEGDQRTDDTTLSATLDDAREQQITNCCVFVVEALEDAGYDLDRPVTVGGVTTTARRVALIHAQTLGLSGNLAATLNDKRGTNEENVRKNEILKGVIAALTESGQGDEVLRVDDLRPGDVLQWWRTDGAGHTTILRNVLTTQGTLTAATDPRSVHAVTVTGVEVIGAQRTLRAAGASEGAPEEEQDLSSHTSGQDDVYTVQTITLSDDKTGSIPGIRAPITRWYAARPSRSPWRAQPAPPVG